MQFCKKRIQSLKSILLYASSICALPGLFLTYKTYYDDPKDIVSKCKKYNIGTAVAIKGALTNNDTLHADKLTIKGKTKGKVLDFYVNPEADYIEKKEGENDNIVLMLNRLSSKSKCDFEIVALKDFEVVDNKFNVNWGKKSSIVVSIEKPDNDSTELVKLIEKTNKLSSNARKTWLKNNPP